MVAATAARRVVMTARARPQRAARRARQRHDLRRALGRRAVGRLQALRPELDRSTTRSSAAPATTSSTPATASTRSPAGGGNDWVKAHFGSGSIDCGGGRDKLFISRRAQRHFTIRGCETISHKTLGRLAAAPPRRRFSRRSANRSSSGACAGRIRSRASSRPNHAARSTSGNSRIRPDRGGHSIVKVLDVTASASMSPSSAHAVTTLPLFWRTSPRSTSVTVGEPVSRAPRRTRAARRPAGPRRRSYSPFGIDQAPMSFFAQNGPPGWTSSTSSARPRRGGAAGSRRCAWRASDT